jgi:IS1 family transposase
LDKKNRTAIKDNYHIMEMDEMYWFVGKKTKTETRENAYIITMVSRLPRQIVGFDVAFDKSPERIQAIVDNAPEAESYATDGFLGYIDVVYPGKHIRNVNNKNDTFTVEGVNADLRHYVPLLARRSRCFPRSIDTLRAVLEVFVDAYNKFGEAKSKYRIPINHKPGNEGKRLHKFREPPFGVVDFL